MMSIVQLDRENRKLMAMFPGSTRRWVMDNLMSRVAGRPIIDIVAFDEVLHDFYGDYEADGLNMEEFIAGKFGESFRARVMRLL
jgi:hypothetical protein